MQLNFQVKESVNSFKILLGNIFESVISFSLVISIRIFLITVVGSLKSVWIHIQEKIISNEIKENGKTVSKIYRAIVFTFYPTLWIFMIGKLIFILNSLLKSNALIIQFNLAELKETVQNVISLFSMTFITISSLFLPSNILTILIFISIAGFLIYLVFGATVFSNNLKIAITFMICALTALGYSHLNSKIESLVGKIKKAFQTMRDSHRTIIPLFFISSFILGIQTLIVSMIILKSNNFWIYIVPGVLLIDWSYNIIYYSIQVFLMHFFYQKNQGKENWKDSSQIIKQNIFEIMLHSFQISIFSLVFNLKFISEFFGGKEAVLARKLTLFEEFYLSFFELGMIYTDQNFYQMSLKGLISEGEIQENIRTEDPKEAKSMLNSGEMILFYIVNFKNFAFRIPIVLTLLSLFKFQIVDLLLKNISYFEFIRKPIFFFEMITNKPSIASLIGFTFYLAMTFYILSAQTSYMANKAYEDEINLRKSQMKDEPNNPIEKVKKTLDDMTKKASDFWNKFFTSQAKGDDDPGITKEELEKEYASQGL